MDSLSEHLRLELAHAVHAGHEPGQAPPLEPADPVPGCGCAVCLGLQAGADPEEAREVVELLRHLALLPPDARQGAVREANAGRSRVGLVPIALPPATLARLAARVPGALQATPDTEDRRQVPADALPVERARRVPILEVARRLGLEIRRVGRSHRGPCPLHGGEDPNFAVVPNDGFYKCFVCGAGGDGIELTRQVLDVSFPEAVRWIAGDGSGTIASRDPRQGTMAGVSP